MWKKLPEQQKITYKKLITSFASLSEAFAQKNDEKTQIIAPIVNSKFQESAFLYSFNAYNEDYANTSYNASLSLKNNEKFLVGIKAFGYRSRYQKIAQFKKDKKEWSDIFKAINDNVQAVKKEKNLTNKEQEEKAYDLNKDHYLKLAKEIARLRNIRLDSSKGRAKNFKKNDRVKTVYHVLMSTPKNTQPQIHIGETDYSHIDISQIKCSVPKLQYPLNFEFTDNNHCYRFTEADSQLLMDFDNKNIIQESWDIDYIQDPFEFFQNLDQIIKPQKNNVADSVSWFIQIEEQSGVNAFNASTKLAKKYRLPRVEKIKKEFPQCNFDIISLLEQYLLKEWNNSKNDIQQKNSIREEIVQLLEKENNQDLTNEVEKLIFRSANEVYIPIPNSKSFHNNKPHFFGENIGLLNGSKLQLPKEQRKFDLAFIPSGTVMSAYINQDYGKAIQSISDQDILGKWLLQDVFQLQGGELLTEKQLNELGNNSIRLIKYTDKSSIGLEFIWVDENNYPQDFMGDKK